MISIRRYIFYVCLMVIMLFMMYDNFKEEMDSLYTQNAILDIKASKHKKRSAWDNKKTIQWYDTYHNNSGLRLRSLSIDFNKCSNKNCKLLKYYEYKPNEHVVQQGPLDADAIIFQGSHLVDMSPPRRRDSNQVFVFAEREPWWNLGMYNSMMSPAKPYKTVKDDDLDWYSRVLPNAVVNPQHYINTVKFRDVFNWTMTYRQDSDIPMLYGRILRNKEVRQSKDIDLLEENNLWTDYEEIFNKKVNDVVWLVSHCSTKSKREKYVEKLKEYIDVDVIGKCGKDVCPKHDRRCIKEIIQKYKFILSFENTFHKDYVTEKLFGWYTKDIIPVVYGMADYKKIVPEDTIINAEDFNSPKLLAQYLKYVGTNRDTYVSFLRRKRKYFTVSHDVMQQTSFCKLCVWLHHLDANRKSYPKIDQWWQLNDTSGFSKLYAQAVPEEYENRNISFLFLFIIVFIVLMVVIYRCGTLAYKTIVSKRKEEVILQVNKY